MKLAIIGTAGRGDDGQKLTSAHWRMMEIIGQTVSTTLGATELVSGGAAWADHVAVSLFNKGHVPALTLYFPADFDTEKCEFVPYSAGIDDMRPPRVANHYHRLFSHAISIDSLRDIQKAIVVCGAKTHVNNCGFKARNSDVANAADAMLAFTFSGHAEPKTGGTSDTLKKFLDRRWKTVSGPLPAFHFDLESKTLFAL